MTVVIEKIIKPSRFNNKPNKNLEGLKTKISKNQSKFKIMINRIVRGIAGTFVLISILLAVYGNINWLWFTAFVGVNLLQSSFTQWCLMDKILAKLGVKAEGDSCTNC